MKQILEYILNKDTKFVKNFDMPENILNNKNQNIIKDLVEFGHANFLSLCNFWEIKDKYFHDLHIAYHNNCEYDNKEYYGFQIAVTREKGIHVSIIIGDEGKKNSSGIPIYCDYIKDISVKEEDVSKTISIILNSLKYK